MGASGNVKAPRRPSPILAPYRVMRARPQLFLSLALGLAVGFSLPDAMQPVARALVAWNAVVLCYFALVAMFVSGATHHTIRERAQQFDEGRFAMLLLTTAIATASFGAVVVELGSVKSMQGWEKGGAVALTLATVLNSWLFLHLTFAFHYAHEYYFEEERDAGEPPEARGGLHFPNTKTPQYIDFLYFAYVIGVAFQTADVETCSGPMRLLVATHGIVAFFYNTTILALMVNVASQLV
ncbi:DUF1345 domain-containing protein [Methylocystis sp. 9N]|uniref:DUF1345 domain-containing protein n=1 Tax=Methylocystis borbori TaxID=3118750 RepID=A0ABU7XL92_9HYPH